MHVAVAGDVAEAAELQDILREAGIEATIEQSAEDDAVCVLVPGSELEPAQDAIEALTEPDDLIAEPWRVSRVRGLHQPTREEHAHAGRHRQSDRSPPSPTGLLRSWPAGWWQTRLMSPATEPGRPALIARSGAARSRRCARRSQTSSRRRYGRRPRVPRLGCSRGRSRGRACRS